MIVTTPGAKSAVHLALKCPTRSNCSPTRSSNEAPRFHNAARRASRKRGQAAGDLCWLGRKVVLDGHVFRVTGRSTPSRRAATPLEKPEGVRAELWDHPMPQKRAESSPLFKAESVILGIRHEHRRRRQSAGSRLSL